MKHLLIYSFAILLLASCAPQKPLYTWGNYGDTSYTYVKETNEKTTEQLIESYKKIIEKQEGLRQVPPPGVCADYGYLLLQANRIEEGKAMLKKEMELYPESKVFIERILKLTEE